MEFEFGIPLNRSDLLSRTTVNQYVVEEVYPLRVLASKLQEFKAAVRTKGALAVLDGFDAVFSVISNMHNVAPQLKEDAWDLTVKAMSDHPNTLVGVLDTELDPSVCQIHRNVLKMNCYLLSQLIDLLEEEICRDNSMSSVGAKGRKKAPKPVSNVWSSDWDYEKERGIRALLGVIDLNIHRLWNPPIVENEFTSLVTNCCYKLLENPGINRRHTTRDAVFRILGIMVKKHNHGLAFTLKTVQLLQHLEHLTTTMALAVQVLATDFGAKTVVVNVMSEIGRMDSRDLNKDTSGTRAFAAFLLELVEKIPELMLPSISMVVGLLDGESYNMRNCVLGILGEIVVRVLSMENLDNNQKVTRDNFLDKLEDHIHDINAFVRSKTLQIWNNIVTKKALPLPRQHRLLKLVTGRLEDKSSQVRKSAIQLISALLRNNPFAAKLTLEELQLNYENEFKKLNDMMTPEVKEEPIDECSGEETDKDDEAWKKIERDVKDAIKAVLDGTNDDEMNDNLISDEDDVNSVTSRVVSLLKDAQNKEAVQLYLTAKDAFPSEPPFSYHTARKADSREEGKEEADADIEEDDMSVVDGQEAKLILNSLRKLFVGEPLEINFEKVVQETLNRDNPGQVPAGLVNEVSKQQVLVQYLKDSMEFVNLLQKAIPILCQLLESKNNTDVLESIDFFVTSYEFGLNNAMLGIHRMLGLVWSKEEPIKLAVVEAYRRLYLTPEKENPRAWASKVAKNLTALTVGATVGELTSLEELVSEFVKSGDLTLGVIQVLWERFALKIPNTTTAESRGALTLLGMAAIANSDIVKSNTDVLLKEGLGPRAEEDFLLARDTCSVLFKLSQSNKKRENKSEPVSKFPQDHDIFQRLHYLLVTGLKKVDKGCWIPMAEEAVNFIYALAEHPDLICRSIFVELDAAIKEFINSEMEVDGTGDKVDSAPASTEKDHIFCTMLTRFLSLAGHVALRQLIHLDVAVFTEMRRRHDLDDQKNETQKSRPGSVKKSKKAQPKDKEEKEVSVEEEMGLAGTVSEDAEAEYIRNITEEHLVTGTANLLALIQPIIVLVCSNPLRFPDLKLQSAATLALSKYMTVSSEFCDQNLQLLFTILEKSPSPVIRANAIIALGNITFRFPNLIEPWTANLYARLRDDSTQVRKNTLVVLTHLILNDMVKVKGQISELATCIVDYDENIAGLAKLFFFELAKKGNAIYNIMPDIISRLSDPELGVEEESFRIIMKYLFSFIQKERQCENLVEKLCQRFKATRVERQWCDLAFCLSMLSYNDKTIRKLQENESCFIDKLSNEDVFNSFMVIISGARKFAKPETKSAVDEFEQKLELAHNRGVEDEEAFAKAKAASTAARAHKLKTPGRRHHATKTRQKSKDESDDESFTKIRSTRKCASRKPKLVLSSDEDDLELFEVQKEKEQEPGRKSVRRGQACNEDISDQENADPNTTYSSPKLIKKRCKLVCAKVAKTQVRASTRSTRNVTLQSD